MNVTQIVMLIACFGAAILIFKMGRENKLFYWASGFFFIVGIFYLVKSLTGDLLSKPWIDLGFRAVAICFLIVLCYFYFKERNGGEK